MDASSHSGLQSEARLDVYTQQDKEAMTDHGSYLYVVFFSPYGYISVAKHKPHLVLVSVHSGSILKAQL